MKPNKTERGQSLVEFAISLTIILFLLAGAVEFGIALFQFIQLRDAAQEGALYGSICPRDDTKIENRVRNASYSPLDLTIASGPDAVDINVEGRVGNDPTASKSLSSVVSGDGIYVEASYDHRIFMPFVPEFIGSKTIQIRAFVIDTVLDTDMSKPECQ
ncbi:pilus assembly protein [Chloroflexi bacterium CFX6]|nr:pilus assembly protein [Chloroflexi bacterium CFX6]